MKTIRLTDSFSKDPPQKDVSQAYNLCYAAALLICVFHTVCSSFTASHFALVDPGFGQGGPRNFVGDFADVAK